MTAKEQFNGDLGFNGANLRMDPSLLPAGMLSDAANYRFRDGKMICRKGVAKLAWSNRLASVDKMQPFGTVHGAAVFSDPTSREWVMVAADNVVYRCRPHNPSNSVPLPAGVKIRSRVNFVQAFSKLYMLRGKFLPTLVMNDLDKGFEDAIPHFDITKTYHKDDEMAYGPFNPVGFTITPVTITHVAATATATAPGHAMKDGYVVTVAGAVQAPYNGTFAIQNTTSDTFDYVMASDPGVDATTGTAFSAAVGLSRNGLIVTAVMSGQHGLVTGADVTIQGAAEAEFNGRFNVTVIDPKIFTFEAAGSTVVGSGSPKVSSMANHWAAIGSQRTLTALSTDGTGKVTATTSVAHGFQNGDSVTITGVTPAVYNGTWTINAAAGSTFTFPGTIGWGAGTVFGTVRNNTIVVTGENPEAHSESWRQIYNVVPNADDGLFANNRLALITAWTPGNVGYDTTSSYTKSDFIVALNFADETHFYFQNEFRINQGSEDELVQLQKFGDSTVVALKGRSWGILNNFTGDLSGMSLDMRGTEYGLSANACSVNVGENVYWLAEKRGVVSLRQTEQGKVQSVDLPLSNEIQPLIDRINWLYVQKARMAYWDNKLYVAVPLDDAKQTPPPINYGVILVNGTPDPVLFQDDAGLAYEIAGGESLVIPATTEIWWMGDSSGHGIVPGGWAFHGSITLNSDLVLVYDGTNTYLPALEGVNNTILIYDFLTQQWTPRDTGSALTVKEFFKAHYNGVERLFFVSEDGFINIMEESLGEDDVADTLSVSGVRFDPIEYRWLTRGYKSDTGNFQRTMEALVTMETWAPSFSIRLIYDGVNENQALDADGNTVRTKDRTKYYRPFDADDYDPTNANDDHAIPYRKDYSVPLAADGISLGKGGVVMDLLQETTEGFNVTARLGRSVQIEGVTTEGLMNVKSIEVTALRRQQRKGTQA